MCGVAGFWGEFEPQVLERMTGRIAHRGPDDAGHWHDPEAGIGLGHRRLSIIDLSPRGHQPMFTPDGDVGIVYNGEVFNYRELRAQLEADGVVFRSDSDTEVLLHLYRRDGPAFLESLNGMFALAIWDARSKELLLARDGVGVKPLYVANTRRGLLFASELKALLVTDDVSRQLDTTGVLQHLGFISCPAPRTALQGVRKLEPGQALLFRDGREVRRWFFYRVPTRSVSQLQQLAPAEAASQVYDAVEEAVRRQMVADVPVGAFLSGGLDSSAIAAFARRQLDDRRLQCFTIRSVGDLDADGFADDLPYASRVAKHLDVDLHIVDARPQDTVDRLERAIWHMDEPQGDLAAINAWMISELAREHGIVVLLSGAGGDDIFSGYRRHHAVMAERWWSWLPSTVRRGVGRGARSLPTRSAQLRRVSKALRDAGVSDDDRLIRYFLWPDAASLPGLLGPSLRGGDAWARVAAPLRQTLATVDPSASPLERMLALEMRHFLADHNLNYTDKMAMAAGVEVRVPLLDPDLIDLACQLPAGLKIRSGHAKWVFKKAMEPLLPHDVIYRPKTGFGVPLRRWMAADTMPENVADALSSTSVANRGLFDPGAVDRLLRDTRSGRSDGAYVLLEMAVIELWCRQFVDVAIPEAPPWEAR